jgi:hypothetical protein
MWKVIVLLVLWGGVGFSGTFLYEDAFMVVSLVALLPSLAIMLA